MEAEDLGKGRLGPFAGNGYGAFANVEQRSASVMGHEGGFFEDVVIAFPNGGAESRSDRRAHKAGVARANGAAEGVAAEFLVGHDLYDAVIVGVVVVEGVF